MDVLELFRNSQNARRLAAGDTVFREGDPGDVMYVLTAGEVAISRDGRTLELVPIDREWFSFLIRKNPAFALHVMARMADRLRRFMQAGA